MGDFRSFSSTDSDEEIAVENLIAQSKDLYVLEQISALRTAHLSDSGLPFDLENRFRKLKSKEGPSTGDTKVRKCENRRKKINFLYPDEGTGLQSSKSHQRESVNAVDPSAVIDLQGFHRVPSRSDSPSSGGSDYFRRTTSRTRRGDLHGESLEKGRPSWSSFLLSPLKACRKKNNREKEVARFDYESKVDEDILSDLSMFSLEEQSRKLKKAWKDEEKKINRESKKILKWAKQASSRMDVRRNEDCWSSEEEK